METELLSESFQRSFPDFIFQATQFRYIDMLSLIFQMVNNFGRVEFAFLFSGRGEVLSHRAIGEQLLVVVRPKVLVGRAHQLVVDDGLPNRAL